MNTSLSEHVRLWQLIEAAHAETDHAAANRLFRDAERLGRQLHDRDPNDAEHCYAIALTFYHRWDTADVRRKCIDWLRKAEELNPSHPWVPLYLGYQFMDDADYANAYVQFGRVDQGYFASIEQHWRNIKTDELMLVALIRGGSSNIASALLVRLADRYAAAERIDQPIPSEIVKALTVPLNRERFDIPAHRIAGEVCRLIRACGDDNVFPDELAASESASHALE